MSAKIVLKERVINIEEGQKFLEKLNNVIGDYIFFDSGNNNGNSACHKGNNTLFPYSQFIATLSCRLSIVCSISINLAIYGNIWMYMSVQ